MSLAYVFSTTIYYGTGGYVFDFGASYFTMTVQKGTSGSMNLYNMPDSLFDGNHYVEVAPAGM
jgi:hypothetical protein